MKRMWVKIIIMVLTMAFVMGAGMASAATKDPSTGRWVFTDAETAYPKFTGNQAKVNAAYGAYMADLKAKTAMASKTAADASAKQDYWLNIISYVPPVGVTMAWYNAGEMDYVRKDIKRLRKGQSVPWGNATTRGVLNVVFKVPAGAPEGMFFYGVNRLFTQRWNELDVYNVFTEYGRPYLVDGVVIGTKVFFGVAGAYAADVGLPYLGGWHHAPINQAFLWMAVGGGSLNLLAGATNQFFCGSYGKYQPRLIWFNSRSPLPTNGL